MKKHFCTCHVQECLSHPYNHDKGCDPCIEKNLELGEVPACFWLNVSKVKGKTEWSADNFAKHVANERGESV